MGLSRFLKNLLIDLYNIRKKLLLSLIPYSIAFVFIFASGYILENHFPNPVTPQDIILDNIPTYNQFVRVGEIGSIATVILLFYTLYKQNLKPFPEYLTRAGLMIMLRAITIVLTPLAAIQDPATNGSLPFFSNMYHGMFFSGHTAGAFLIVFLDNYSKKTKMLKLFFATIVAVSLILSHSHYSIDIVGGILAAYAMSKINLREFISFFSFESVSENTSTQKSGLK